MNVSVMRPLVFVTMMISLVATATAEPAAWILIAISGFIALVLGWSALTDGSVAAPVVTLLVTAVLFTFPSDNLAIGPLIGAVFALVTGDLLWAAQAVGDQGRAVVRPVDAFGSALTTAGVSTGAIVVVLFAARLPDRRIWSAAAIVGLVILAGAVQRRRRTMVPVPLPPPR